ncbi:hypothetical protein [Rummeliibacillus pycnus]|uniref:hypothetical protein n=1 Tax=Rummeliibacillus pycnus TaxID=101070 RepID=UPI003D27E621
MKKLLGALLLVVLLVGCSEQTTQGKGEVHSTKWEVSPTFDIPVNFGDGKKGKYVLIGKEGRMGFLIGSGSGDHVAIDPIIEGKGNKYMWHFWGNKDEFDGPLKVVGINEKGEKHKILTDGDSKVWSYPGVGISPNNGATTHVPSLMEFPTAGLWKLKVYIDDQLFGDIVVDVEES